MLIAKQRGGRWLAAVAAVAASTLLVAGCGSSSGGNSGGGNSSGAKNYNVTFIPKSLGNKYFQASDSGGKSAVTSFGGTFKEVGPTEASATSQSPFIQTARDAIAYLPVGRPMVGSLQMVQRLQEHPHA